MNISKGQKYKLEKKIKKGDVSDEMEIINSYVNKNAFLPIEEFAKELIYTIDKNNVTIILGETGCGKTTKIPEFLLRSGHTNIAHILQRKIATITVAQRVCQNMNLTLGKEIGYSVRFDYNYSDSESKLKFLTEGMFIRELLSDPLLKKYNVIIIDDCHERTINSELIFGFLKKICKKRKDVKIIISSATLDYQCYINFFNKEAGFLSDIFLITGRAYPVDIFYLDKPVKNYIESSVLTAMNIHKNNSKNAGDILVFLTGQEEINIFLEMSQSYGFNSQSDILFLPLCAGLSAERQLEVFKPTPHNKRKIIISTNIAEASVTIDNIAFVIDSCQVKIKFYNSKIDSDGLYIIPASKFSLDQRAGRAGRTRPGKCYRMITSNVYESLYQMSNPELLRRNLFEYILRLKSMGIKDLKKFETLTTPDKNTIARSLENLYFLGVLDDKSNLTELGIKVCDLPIDPRLAVAIFKSGELKFKCTEDVLTIAAMLSMHNLFIQPNDPSFLMKSKQRLGVIEGDHLSLLNIYKQFKYCKTGKSKFCKDLYINENIMKQVDEMIVNLKPYMKKYNISLKTSLDNDGEDILQSFLKGFFFNVAQKQSDGSYRSLRWNIPVHIHPTSVLYTIMPNFVLYYEIVSTAKNYIKDVSKIEKSWIMEVSSNFYEDRTTKIINERHKEEVVFLSGIDKKIPAINGEQKFKKKEGLSMNNVIKKPIIVESNRNIHSTTPTNRIYMDVDKNKEISYYFGDCGKEDEKIEIKKDLKIKNDVVENVEIEPVKDIEEDTNNVTFLRRMRKRK